MMEHEPGIKTSSYGSHFDLIPVRAFRYLILVSLPANVDSGGLFIRTHAGSSRRVTTLDGNGVTWRVDLDEFDRRYPMDRSNPVVKKGILLVDDLNQHLREHSDEVSGEPLGYAARTVIEDWAARTGKHFVPSTWSPPVFAIRAAIFSLDDYSCIFCTAPATDIEHLTAKSERKLPDPNVPTNLAAACDWCNTQKSKLSVAEFAEWAGSKKVAMRLAAEAEAWEKTHLEHAMVVKRRIVGLANFASERLLLCKRLVERSLLMDRSKRV